MAVSSSFRWVAVGSLQIRQHQKAPSDFELCYTIHDLADALRELTNEDHRWYAKDTRAMWCTHVVSSPKHYMFLLHDANSNAADFTFYNFETSKRRYINKTPSEGGLYSSHVIVHKEPDYAGRHLVLIEKVPGVHLSSTKAHFGWASSVTQEQDQPRTQFPVLELDGYQSITVREALDTGRLRDIELVKVVKDYDDGIDEEASGVDELIQSAVLKARNDASKRQIHGMLGRIRAFKNTHFGENSDTQTYIRIKTGDGQTRRAEIHNTDRDAVLEEAFVHNELVRNFEFPLRTTYMEPLAEMERKLVEIGDRLCGST